MRAGDARVRRSPAGEERRAVGKGWGARRGRETTEKRDTAARGKGGCASEKGGVAREEKSKQRHGKEGGKVENRPRDDRVREGDGRLSERCAGGRVGRQEEGGQTQARRSGSEREGATRAVEPRRLVAKWRGRGSADGLSGNLMGIQWQLGIRGSLAGRDGNAVLHGVTYCPSLKIYSSPESSPLLSLFLSLLRLTVALPSSLRYHPRVYICLSLSLPLCLARAEVYE